MQCYVCASNGSGGLAHSTRARVCGTGATRVGVALGRANMYPGKRAYAGTFLFLLAAGLALMLHHHLRGPGRCKPLSQLNLRRGLTGQGFRA